LTISKDVEELSDSNQCLTLFRFFLPLALVIISKKVISFKIVERASSFASGDAKLPRTPRVMIVNCDIFPFFKCRINHLEKGGILILGGFEKSERIKVNFWEMSRSMLN